MKFRAIALDFDGTIAVDGQLDPEVRSAIKEARRKGVVVLIVTGRILSELVRLTGPIDFVDAVVAENGAVLAFSSLNTTVVGRVPPAIFLEELCKRGLFFKAGQCVVEMEADFAPEILEIVRTKELPLGLAFNRSRLMVLPFNISKASGLRKALTILRVSPHNTIGIGDGENDHDLLSACEVGVAVAWGSKMLQSEADQVILGNGPAAVAQYIRDVASHMRLPAEHSDRARLLLGSGSHGDPVFLSLRAKNILVAGDTQSGKSWIAGLICEQLILQGYSLCVIDAEGDYRTLASLPGVVVFGGDNPLPELPDLARVLSHPYMSVVLDLSHVPQPEKINLLNSLLPMLASLRRNTGLPHRIVLDEAHYFLSGANVRGLIDFDLGAYVFVTYHFAALHPDIRKAIEVVIMRRTNEGSEVEALKGMASCPLAVQEMLSSLSMEEALLVPGAGNQADSWRKFRLRPRWTIHVRHESKYVDVQVIEQEGFVFTNNGRPVQPARNLNEFVNLLRVLPASIIDEHARRGDYSRWIGDVFRDHVLATTIGVLERRARVESAGNLSAAIAAAIEQRYETHDLESRNWGETRSQSRRETVTPA